MLRALSLTSALLVASGAAADVTVIDPEDHRAVARELNELNNPIPRRAVAFSGDSGVVRAPVTEPGVRPKAMQVPVWSQEFGVDDAGWIRLRFGEVVLAPATDTARESYLKITSLYDGHEQYLDSQSIREWAFTSAYFNGGRVRVTLMASPDANPGVNRVQVTGATVSEPTNFPRSICGTTDDRVLSDDPRAARMMPIGCTGWLFGDQPHSFLSAGHCAPGSGDVMQFNVPLSTAGGTPQNPGPQDQYPIDPASAQYISGGVGNDWAFYGTFANSNTGLAPRDAMGDSYVLAAQVPSPDGRPIRVTGYGSTSAPVPPTWYLVQKTHVGSFVAAPGTSLQYNPDTTGGNSGSAVYDDSTSTAIGIHTHAGCTATGGANQGTSLNNAGLQNALANPQGITLPLGLDMDLVGTRPDLINPDGSTSISITVAPDNGLTPSGVVVLHTSAGDVVMTNAGGNTWSANFPVTSCGDAITYSFSAQDNTGGTWTLPASGAYTTLSATDLAIAFSDNFQTNQGWTVQNVALTTGAWQRGVPGNFGRNDPPADYDGSGQCYVTGNALNDDVDGGPTYLISPVIQLAGLNDPIVSFARWHQTNGDDVLTVEFSDNLGASWVNVETVNSGTNWVLAEHRVGDYVSTGGTLMVRFASSDNPNTYITESGIDAFKVIDVICDTGCPADLAEPFGTLNIFDIQTYIGLYNAQDPAADLAAPFGTFNIFDIQQYIDLYNQGCP
ncbi:MAG: hypothetical protein D6692_08960 [Planctomycetota bacterium]|nr:MAG: hypothetical protein D6692_08960 [Planctomycetota bacterium]